MPALRSPRARRLGPQLLARPCPPPGPPVHHPRDRRRRARLLPVHRPRARRRPGLAPTPLGVATDRPLRSCNAVINGELRAASLAYGGSSYQNSSGCGAMRARRAVMRARSVWPSASRTAAKQPLRSLKRSPRQRRRRRAGGVACTSGRHDTSSPRPRHRVGVGRGRCNGDPPYAVITPFVTAASRVGANPEKTYGGESEVGLSPC